MIVNGFRLPDAFVQLCATIQRGEAPDEWDLSGKADAYGHPWTSFGLILFTDPQLIAQETRDMQRKFREDDRLQQDEEARNEPGFIQDFTGVANYVQFGKNDTGDPYCFDFGAVPSEPSVVTWPDADCYWRRVAPNFEAFMTLFSDTDEAPEHAEGVPPLELGDVEWEESDASPGALLVSHMKYYLRTEVENRSTVFEALEEEYADASAAERVAAESQVLSELEAQGITDAQRQLLNEAWARLRAMD